LVFRFGGAEFESRRRDNLGAVGAEGVGVWGGGLHQLGGDWGRDNAPPQKIFKFCPYKCAMYSAYFT